MSQSVKSRAVFFVGGYDPKSPESFYARLRREATRFSKLWDVNVESERSTPVNEDITYAWFSADTEDWKTQTDFHFFSVDDIVQKDFGRNFFGRVGRYLMTSADYMLTGTGPKFVKYAWRFFLYFSYPITVALMSVLLTGLLGWFISGLNFQYAPLAGFAAFAALMWLLVQFVWKRYYVLHLMDLWNFSRDYLRRNRRDIDEKLDRFGEVIAKVVSEGTYDEVLLVGHSTGGALILDAAARALDRDPDLANKTRSFNILTVGSTALKIGLHPAADWFRARVKKLCTNKDINWVEYQCRTDIINFHRTNPAELMNAETAGRSIPSIANIKVRAMVTPDTYKRIRKNFFRVHYQFVFGNSQKFHYDFPAICFGPRKLTERVSYPVAFNDSLSPELKK